MSAIYSIENKIKETLHQHATAAKASLVFADILKDCPFVRQDIKAGKLYVFDYFPPSIKKKMIDTKPYLMSLGPDKEKPNLFYGIDMHHIPYKMRVQIFKFIYDMFMLDIEDETKKWPDAKDSLKQKSLSKLNTDIITKSPFNVNISPCIKRYNIEFVSNCYCVNYNLVHYMLLSEENYFVNGSIKEAQEEFLEHIFDKKKTR